MCGIVGYVGNENAVPILIDGLLSLEYRGYDSAGIAVINNIDKIKNQLEVIKSKGKVENLQEKLKNKKIYSNIGIAHTRWATHGEPSDINAHPHTDNSNTFAVVHNGIIENYDELKNKLIKNGYKFKSETDTEIIPNLLSYYFNEEIKKNNNSKIEQKESYLNAISKTAKTLKGSFAIEIISVLFPDEIIIVKKDSPLVLGYKKDEKFIASDVPAIIKYTNEFYFMNDYEIAEITKNKINFYDFNLKQISKKIKKVDMDQNASSKNGYQDFMIKEIHEEPKAIERTIKNIIIKEKDKKNNKNLYKIKLDLKNIDFLKFNKIYIVACGTAMHAGLATKNVFEKFSKIQTEVDMASEFRYRDPLINKKTLCIFISQSGETADTIAALKLAKEKKCTTIAIVNVMESSITRMADYVLYTKAGPENAVASTKAYTCQVTLLEILAMYIYENVREKHIKNKSEIEKLEKEEIDVLDSITKLPKLVEETLKCEEKVKALSHKYYNNKDMYFIGRGIDYAVAREGSLKLKEISYIHSEAQAAGELKHGPIALIENKTPVIGIATNEKTNMKTFSNIEEVITRGAETILITNTEEKIPDVIEKNDVIRIPKITPTISSIISIIPMQLFAYYIAKEKKLDVDKPRNLAKSVTVE